MKGSAILFLLCCAVFTAVVSGCPDGWFGSRCQYKCHCLNNGPCDQNTGTCQIGCERGWFGPSCQYADLAAMSSRSYWDTYMRILSDNNDTTCINDMTSPSEVYLTLDRANPFTWLRLHVQDPDFLDNITVTFLGGSSLECQNQRKAVVSERTLDIHCDLNGAIKQVILHGQGVKALCSVYISGGRNIALHEIAQQSSTYSYSGIKSYPADLAVDGNTNGYFNQGQTCTHTADGDPSPWWSLTFQKPPRLVTRYVLYNRLVDADCLESCAERLNGFTLTSFGKDIPVVLTYTDVMPTARSVYTVIQDPWLEPVSHFNIYLNSSREFLTLCEVEAYGDSICETGKYGRDCEHTCNCAQNESCFVSTGGCPSGCPAGFWGESCDTVKSDHSELTRGVGIGVGVSVGLIVIATVVIALIVLYRRKMKSQTQAQACISNSDFPRETSSAPGEVLASSNTEDPDGYETIVVNDYEVIKGHNANVQ